MSAASIPIAEIGELHTDDYVGLIDPAAIELLTVRLAAEGLLTPIWVRKNGNAAAKRWSVIAGRHRLRAATALGWTEIAAVERAGSGSDAGELRALQVAENLDRRVLRPIERACFIMERWRAWEMASQPQSEAASDLLATVANTDAVDEATAAACGCASRTVRRYRQLYAALVVGLPGLFAQLNAHPLGESLSAMNRLATLNEIACRLGAEMILSRPDWVSIDAALIAAGVADSKGNRDDPDKPDATFLSAWSNMSPVRRRVTALAWAKEVLPSEVLAILNVWKERKIVNDRTTIA